MKTYADSVLVQDVSYVYDFNNNLIGRSITTEAGTTVTRFVNDGGNMALAFDGSGNLQDRYLDAGGRRSHPRRRKSDLRWKIAGETLWPLSDNQGTIRDVIFADGSLDDHFAYDPFGVRTGGGETEDFLFGYTGVYTDPATGSSIPQRPLDRHRRPLVQSSIAALDRAPSPTGLAFGPDPFEYCKNAPTDWSDPTGLYKACTTDVFIGHGDDVIRAARAAAKQGLPTPNNESAILPRNWLQRSRRRLGYAFHRYQQTPCGPGDYPPTRLGIRP